MDREPPFTRFRLNVPPRVHHCERRWGWNPPPLPDYDLWIALAGAGKLALGERAYTVGAGIGFVLPPGSRPRGTHDPDRRLVVFAAHFSPLDARGRVVPLRASDLPPPATVVRDLGLMSALAHRASCSLRTSPSLSACSRSTSLSCLLFRANTPRFACNVFCT
jgi:hypothetical protein